MKKEPALVFMSGLLLVLMVFYEVPPFRTLADWRAGQKATANVNSDHVYKVYDLSIQDRASLEVDILAGTHYWNPQIAIWVEDTLGNHLGTNFVTNSTATGTFYGGRSADNFKEFDTRKISDANIRRVNALPFWSHKRNVIAKDGSYAPHPDHPLPDGISGATPNGNFIVKSNLNDESITSSPFIIYLEVNVAFDENEFFSQYDYPDDTIYHSGTGLLGQPSLIYASPAINSLDNRFYFMELIGHGHHSGQSGELFTDLSRITTAKEIIKRIVIGINKSP